MNGLCEGLVGSALFAAICWIVWCAYGLSRTWQYRGSWRTYKIDGGQLTEIPNAIGTISCKHWWSPYDLELKGSDQGREHCGTVMVNAAAPNRASVVLHYKDQIEFTAQEYFKPDKETMYVSTAKPDYDYHVLKRAAGYRDTRL
ncbi:MAG TPA: hypothetical protein VG797_04830 [Phycisphaerales bacterium]|nr:hypothetical protein [Phycisphaerales bacterium]